MASNISLPEDDFLPACGSDDSRRKSISSTPNDDYYEDNSNIAIKLDMPTCWSDDVRMSFLFAPFRSKELNVVSYNSKQKFWKDLIRKYCETKGSAQVTLPELRTAFQRNGKKPYALETVLLEMEVENEVVKLNTFMESPQLTWSSWAHRSLTKVVAWPVYQVKNRLWSVSGEETVRQGCAVVVRSTVKDQAEILQKKLSSFLDRVVDVEMVYSHQMGLTRDGIDLAIHHLLCNKRAALTTYNSCNGQQITLVKICGPNKVVHEISIQERNIYDLNLSANNHTKQIEMLEEKIHEADKHIRQLVHEKKTNLAKIKLRQKKSLEQKLEKLSSVLLNIQGMISSIDDSQQTSEIVSTYQLASSTLRSSYAESGINANTLDDVLAEVQETFDDHADVQEVLNTATKEQLGNISETDLEHELDELLKSEEEEQAAKNQREKDLDQSIERRLHELQISGFADLSLDEQRQIIGDSVGSLDELLKIKVNEKRPQNVVEAKTGAL